MQQPSSELEKNLPPSSPDVAAPARTVLVADDDETTRVLIRAALEQDGWVVEEAEDGQAASEGVERVQPDIVLLDVSMPRVDGFEACTRLRSLPAGRHIPVLMVTGMDDQESISRAYEVGATDFLPKPFNYTVLRQRLQYMFRAEAASRELRNERDFVSAVVHTSAALVMVLEPDGRIVRFNPSCEDASGFSAREATGRRVWELLSNPEERDAERARLERLVTERFTQTYEGIWATKDGSQRQIAWSNSVLLNADGAVDHVVCTGLDITDRNQAEERVRFLASYDPLTGLPNRRLVSERLEQAIANAGNKTVAFVILDLDRFKDVNATWGHPAGDQLLKEVADRFTKSLRLSDMLARRSPGLTTELGRLGGDEFAAQVSGVSDANEVALIIERLQHALSRPFRFQGHEFTVTASVGAALYPADGGDSESLLRNAESAMNAAREEMRGSYHFYSVAMHETVSERLSLENELRQAVDRNELVLYYQPKQFTRTGRISGAEALVRWQHPTRGLLGPGAFIDVAEETGLIVPIGEWVLREACGQIMSWLDAGIDVVPVAVNLSSAQFSVVDLLTRIATILNETNVEPRYLAVEITESMIMRDTVQAYEVLSRLNELGVQVAIDDFGTGHSTLSSLKELPLHHLKIDRAFVRDLAVGTKDLAITRAIIAMAHGLGLSVVAEGVESDEQLRILQQEACDEVQGFLIGQPVPSDQFRDLLSQPPSDPERTPTPTGQP